MLTTVSSARIIFNMQWCINEFKFKAPYWPYLVIEYNNGAVEQLLTCPLLFILNLLRLRIN